MASILGKLDKYENLRTSLELEPEEIALLRKVLAEVAPASKAPRRERRDTVHLFADIVNELKHMVVDGEEKAPKGHYGESDVDMMISAYGATPHKSMVKTVLEASKGAGSKAVKNVVRTAGALVAFGAARSFREVVPYLGPDARERVQPLFAAIRSWDFDLWAVVDALDGDQRLAAKVMAEHVLVTARDLAPGQQAAVVRACVDDVVAAYEAAQHIGDSTSLQRWCSRSNVREESIHASSSPREVISRPKLSQTEWKPIEI